MSILPKWDKWLIAYTLVAFLPLMFFAHHLYLAFFYVLFYSSIFILAVILIVRENICRFKIEHPRIFKKNISENSECLFTFCMSLIIALRDRKSVV